MKQMYNVVANIESYRLFVPWCNSSRVLSHRKGLMRAELEVGFSPLVERYISEISLSPHQIRVRGWQGAAAGIFPRGGWEGVVQRLLGGQLETWCLAWRH